ncbi:MAG TPA: hypothetical protein VNR37_00855 [Microbacteriaceae bacterium]|nr:hypothetical protein [Microbacteriaceae bacterium]
MGAAAAADEAALALGHRNLKALAHYSDRRELIVDLAVLDRLNPAASAASRLLEKLNEIAGEFGCVVDPAGVAGFAVHGDQAAEAMLAIDDAGAVRLIPLDDPYFPVHFGEIE